MSSEILPEVQQDPARRPPPPVDWTDVKRVHIMGICGSAMGAFAGMLRTRGFEVRGSDKGAYPPMSTRLKAQNVHIYEGYRAENLDWNPDVVVVGNVIRPDYEEAVALRERGLPACSLPQALAALFISGRHSVVVTGTHGKTTTTTLKQRRRRRRHLSHRSALLREEEEEDFCQSMRMMRTRERDTMSFESFSPFWGDECRTFNGVDARTG